MAKQEHLKRTEHGAHSSRNITSSLRPHSAITTAPPLRAGLFPPDILGWTQLCRQQPHCLWTPEDAETFPVSRLPPDAGVTEVLKPEIREKTGGG